MVQSVSQLRYGHHRLGRHLAAGTISVSCLLSSGCGGDITPSFNSLSPDNTRPTVANLVDHIECEIASAMYRNLGYPGERKRAYGPLPQDRDALWDRLIEANFVASVTLTLQVTNSEGLNPSITFPRPFAPIATPGLTPANPVAYSGNFTLGVNGQFDASQFRSFNVVYYLDFKELYDSYYKDQHALVGTDGVLACATKGILGGNLGLEEIIYSGLTALNEGRKYNVYAAPDREEAGLPTRRKEIAAAPSGHVVSPVARKPDFSGSIREAEATKQAPTPENAARLQQSLPPESSVRVKGLAADVHEYIDQNKPNIDKALTRTKIDALENELSSEDRESAFNKQVQALGSEIASLKSAINKLSDKEDKSKTTAPSSAVYFNSTVQFTITTGLSGGPSWTLRHFTGPNGGGGGGAGAGGGAGSKGGSGGTGASGGGGGNGSASSGFLNFNRNELDSMLIQAAATCRGVTYAKGDYWNNVPLCSVASKSDAIAGYNTLFSLVTATHVN